MSKKKKETSEALNHLLDRVREKPELEFLFELKKDYPQAWIYLVGGIVRDAIMGLGSSDFDFVVSGIERGELESFLEKRGKIATSSDIQTAVFCFLPQGAPKDAELVDIALPRREAYEGKSRKPEVSTGDVSVEEDLSRRDFTINSLALSIDPGLDACGALVDPYDGVGDINRQLIKAVGQPKERFNEDPLRMLRAVRFAVRFDFDIEENTLQAIRDMHKEIFKKYEDDEGSISQRVSNERVNKELSKSLLADPIGTLEFYEGTGLLAEVLPEISKLQGVDQGEKYHSEGDVYTHTKLALRRLPEDADLSLVLATLLHDTGKPDAKLRKDGEIHFYGHEKKSKKIAKKVLKRYAYPNYIKDEVLWLVENHMRILHFVEMRRAKKIRLVEDERFKNLLLLAEADLSSSIRPDGTTDVYMVDEERKEAKKLLDELEKELREKRPRQVLDGHDIIEIINDLYPSEDPENFGPTIGQIKQEVNEAWLNHDIDTLDEAKKMAYELLLEKNDNIDSE